MIRAAMTADNWQREYLCGRNTIIVDAIEQAPPQHPEAADKTTAPVSANS
jgi:hypothetical protein